MRMCGGKPNFWNGGSGDPLGKLGPHRRGVVGLLGLAVVVEVKDSKWCCFHELNSRF